jgi:CRP-like cAMP-binding protein
VIGLIIARRRIDERILLLFRHLADRFGHPRRGGIEVTLPLTHRMIGDVIAAPRPTVTTALTQLHDEGVLVRREGGRILTGRESAPHRCQPTDTTRTRRVSSGVTRDGIVASASA